MAHESGSDWNSEKLQKYVSESCCSSVSSSSGISPVSRAMRRILWQMAQKTFSASTRCSSVRWPSENSVRTSSLYSVASW